MTNRLPIRILMVEDNPSDVFLFKAGLSKAPELTFDLLHCERLAEALRTLRREHIDLIISDLNLPDSIGVATVQQLVAAKPDVPIVVLTGWEDPVTGAQVIREGARHYWSKDRLFGSDLAATLVKLTKHPSRHT